MGSTRTGRPKTQPRATSRRAAGNVRRVRALPKMPRRPTDGHKGLFGRVMVIGGSRGMIGAPALAANAALRSGAGLVTVACPEAIQLAVASLCPCATSLPLTGNDLGMLDPQRLPAAISSMDRADPSSRPTVIAAGPGLGRGDRAFDQAWLRLLATFDRAGVPVVLDADGLHPLRQPGSGRAGLSGSAVRLSRTVLTPHPGEMARLHGVTTSHVQEDRESYALATARQLNAGDGRDAAVRAVVVLKGAGTLVTDGERLYRNRTGNAGMATGGSGDVLTGVIAGLIGQGLSMFEAAVLGVHVHGLAGDLAARDLGQVSVTAEDLIDYLPNAFKRLRRT